MPLTLYPVTSPPLVNYLFVCEAASGELIEPTNFRIRQEHIRGSLMTNLVVSRPPTIVYPHPPLEFARIGLRSLL